MKTIEVKLVIKVPKQFMTPQGKITKIPSNVEDIDLVTERLCPDAHCMSGGGDYVVFCDRYHARHLDERIEASIASRRFSSAAKKSASVASKLLAAKARKIGMNLSCLMPGWIGEVCRVNRIPQALLRYAFSPGDYTAPATAPKLP